MEVKSIIDLVLGKKDMLRYMRHVRAVRRIGRGLSDHYLKVKVCVVVGYGPSEGDDDEKERFWSDMDRTVDSVRNGYRLCLLSDLNGWIRDGITGDFGVLGENGNGRRVVEVWAER